MNLFTQSLLADGPSPELGEGAGVYAWLIGSWEADVIDYSEDGGQRLGRGEWHFAWVLEGRAIQDVWISPPRAERDGASKAGNRYGATLRVYEASLDAWRITWINPVSGAHVELTGRKVGDDIIQDGRAPDGSLMRWSFREITPHSFLWLGESSPDEGKTWNLEAEFRVRRAPA